MLYAIRSLLRPKILYNLIATVPCVVVVPVNDGYNMCAGCDNILPGRMILAEIPHGITRRACFRCDAFPESVILQISTPDSIPGRHIIIEVPLCRYSGIYIPPCASSDSADSPYDTVTHIGPFRVWIVVSKAHDIIIGKKKDIHEQMNVFNPFSFRLLYVLPNPRQRFIHNRFHPLD